MNAIIANNEKEIAKVKNNKLWFKRAAVDFPLTDEQYAVFKKGYAPDWDCRFAPVYMDGFILRAPAIGCSSSNMRGRKMVYGT